MTLEWAALEMVRVDTSSFIRYLEDHCERRPLLRERVEGELESITILLTERLVDYLTQSESVQSKTDGLGIIRDEGDWSSTEKGSDSSVMLDEGSRSHFCACIRT